MICAAWIALSLGAAHADPAADALRDRVEAELLSDGVSLARLGQRLELRASGTALEVVIADRGTGAVVASRVVDKLPALPAAAADELTVVVSGLLRERGLIAPGGGADWGETFAPATVVAYHRPSSVAVIAPAQPGRPGSEARMAAFALVSAYRKAGVATVKDGSALGPIDEVEDAAIVARAAVLAVDKVAVVRAFVEGPLVRAIVAVYAANGQLATGFTGIAGRPMPMPVGPPPAAPQPAATTAAIAAAPRATTERAAPPPAPGHPPTEPAPAKDGVVRLWVTSKTPNVQLMRTAVGPISIDGAPGVLTTSSVVCLAPCGTVVDGSLGETFAFGLEEKPRTDTFQLLGRTGDVTANVTPGNRRVRRLGIGLILAGGTLAVSGVLYRVSGRETLSDFGTGFLVTGAVSALVGGLLCSAGMSDVAFSAGRPK